MLGLDYYPNLVHSSEEASSNEKLQMTNSIAISYDYFVALKTIHILTSGNSPNTIKPKIKFTTLCCVFVKNHNKL